MAIGDDFSVSVAGDIRHVANTNTYTVLQLHRWLMDLADDQAASTSSNDLVDIASDTPSERITDSIINLLGTYNIDDDASEYFYGGSISQADGDTIYSGLQVLGAVNTAATTLTIVQDGAFYDSATAPFWGDQTTPFNGDTGTGVLMRLLVKTREDGYDINSQKVRLQARHYSGSAGDTYDFFDVQLGTGEAVGAISTAFDPQNNTAQATVTAYTHVTNSGGTANAPTGGYQLIDIQDANGDQPYYSKWTVGVDTSGDGIKGMYEYLKDLTRTGTSKTCDALSGDLFLGLTHEIDYDGESGDFSEREWLVWGTTITYGTLTGGTFARGDYIVFGNGNAGKVVYDNGSTTCVVALEDLTNAPSGTDTMTAYAPGGGATGVTAAVSTATDADKAGGELWTLAVDTTSNIVWGQLFHGAAPTDGQELRGITSTETADTNTTPTRPSVPKMFLGSYTGSLIGAFGVGVDADDLGYPDTVIDLDGDINSAPNNVTFTVDGLVSGEDYVLVGWKDTGNDFDKDQLTLNTSLNAPGQTSVVCTAAIPTDTPKPTGTIRVQLDVETYRRVAYTSWATDTFTTASTDWSDPDDATEPRNIFISYIDKLATGTSESFTVVYNTPRTLWIRVRDGGTAGDNIPIKPIGTQGTLGANGGSITITRTNDV